MGPSTRWKKWARNLGSPASVSARLKPRHCGSCGILAAAASYERFSPTSRHLLTGAADRQLSGAARAFRLSHDLLAELVEAGRTGSLQCALNIGGFDFAPGMDRSWRGRARFK